MELSETQFVFNGRVYDYMKWYYDIEEGLPPGLSLDLLQENQKETKTKSIPDRGMSELEERAERVARELGF